jgi:hypothetical protein
MLAESRIQSARILAASLIPAPLVGLAFSRLVGPVHIAMLSLIANRDDDAQFRSVVPASLSREGGISQGNYRPGSMADELLDRSARDGEGLWGTAAPRARSF